MSTREAPPVDRRPIVVVHVDHPVSRDQAEAIRDHVQQRIGPDRPLVVTGPGMTLYEIEARRAVPLATVAVSVAILALILAATAFAILMFF